MRITSCGSNNIGENIYLLEGDRKEDRIIVECTGKNFGDCIGGTYLIRDPTMSTSITGNIQNLLMRLK